MEERLPGGNAGGALLVDGTVRRPTGPWTPSVHALLRHLEQRGFGGAPRVLGVDDRGREVLSFLAGTTVGLSAPWPAWTHSEQALRDVGGWLRRYHQTVADFQPPPDAVWRATDQQWQPGQIIGHNDAAPYNAVWQAEGADQGALVGFVDWDFAGPCRPLWDLAFVALSWVPLHARRVVTAQGFTDFPGRPRRLRLLLDAYGWDGSIAEVLDAVDARIRAHVAGLRQAARTDPLLARLLDDGVASDLAQALSELRIDRDQLTALC